MKTLFISVSLFLSFTLYATALHFTEEQLFKRIQAHLLIEDYLSAQKEAQTALEKYPQSKNLFAAYIQAVAACGEEQKALSLLEEFTKKFKDTAMQHFLMEEIAWGTLNKGIYSTQYSIRLSSLVGAFLTKDSRAVKMVLHMMDDSNAVIRSIAIRLAAQLGDPPLKEKISHLYSQEKIWLVRLEIIKAIGAMKIKEREKDLKQIASDDLATFEEKAQAIESLVNLSDQISPKEWKILANSPSSGLRQFACSIAAHLKLKEAKEHILDLIDDTHPQVRIAALNTFALTYLQKMDKELVKRLLAPSLNDTDAAVSITACWVAFLVDPKFAETHLKKWIHHKNPQHRRLAAAALGTTGSNGLSCLMSVIQSSEDPYVRANVALGLIGQQQMVKQCCDILFDLMKNKQQMWMWDTRQNSLFHVLCPSEIRHVDQIPHYPEAIDQLTHLNLLAILAIMEDSRSQEALKSFLKKKTWGITGTAIATLIQEGDEESLKALKALLSSAEEEEHIKAQAAWVLALLGKDESAVPVLQSIYPKADYERKQQILEALGNVAKADSMPFFITVLKERSETLRIIGASACIQSLNR